VSADQSSLRVWIVSELYYPEETSTGYLLTRIAEHLAQTRRVSVLCSQPTYRARGIRAPERENRNGVDIERTAGTTCDKNSLAGRVVNMLTISASLFARALQRFKRGDIVIVVTNPPLLPFLTAAAARIRGADTIVLVHDVYPEVLIATGLTVHGSLLARTIGFLTRVLYRSVARIVVIGRDMKEIVRRKLPPGDSRVTLITNWADLSAVLPRERGANAILRRENLLSNLVLQYAGNMGRSHDIEVILDATRSDEFPAEIVFLFLGDGAKRPLVEREQSHGKNGHLRLLGAFPREQQSEFLNACDAAIITFVTGMAGISVPSRMYNVLAAGKPILAVADEGSELALVVREHDVGWVVRPGDGPGFMAALDKIARNRHLLSGMGMRARAVAEQHYAADSVLAGYDRLIDDVVRARA
jgi:glycosyltransferase involved in cell wall biosynthesis